MYACFEFPCALQNYFALRLGVSMLMSSTERTAGVERSSDGFSCCRGEISPTRNNGD